MTGMILADGAFDPVHAGHLRYLRHAATYAKAPLWVTIASDDDIRAKGREPLLPGDVRIAVVKALKGVAGAHLKMAPMVDVLDQLRPVCYVKGADWQGRLPQAQIDTCARLQIPIYFTPPETAPGRALLWPLCCWWR
jgi:cytidyltransferase-like protein